jgi:hypothetical protein
MAMPEFLDNIRNAAKNPTGWLSPATVADLLEIDFHTMRPEQREKLFQAVERFKAIAEIASPAPEQVAEARAAFDAILDIVQPYLTPESVEIRELIVKAWRNERDWVSTFDYELGTNWSRQPVVWLWLVMKDTGHEGDEDLDKFFPSEEWRRVSAAIRKEFQNARIERFPNISLRLESEVRELLARAIA